VKKVRYAIGAIGVAGLLPAAAAPALAATAQVPHGKASPSATAGRSAKGKKVAPLFMDRAATAVASAASSSSVTPPASSYTSQEPTRPGTSATTSSSTVVPGTVKHATCGTAYHSRAYNATPPTSSLNVYYSRVITASGGACISNAFATLNEGHTGLEARFRIYSKQGGPRVYQKYVKGIIGHGVKGSEWTSFWVKGLGLDIYGHHQKPEVCEALVNEQHGATVEYGPLCKVLKY
jgi:hypothetical protein